MNKTLKCVISIYFIYSIKIKQKNILALIFYSHNTKLSIKQFKNLFRTYFFLGGGHQPGNQVGTSLFALNIPPSGLKIFSTHILSSQPPFGTEFLLSCTCGEPYMYIPPPPQMKIKAGSSRGDTPLPTHKTWKTTSKIGTLGLKLKMNGIYALPNLSPRRLLFNLFCARARYAV